MCHPLPNTPLFQWNTPLARDFLNIQVCSESILGEIVVRSLYNIHCCIHVVRIWNFRGSTGAYVYLNGAKVPSDRGRPRVSRPRDSYCPKFVPRETGAGCVRQGPRRCSAARPQSPLRRRSVGFDGARAHARMGGSMIPPICWWGHLSRDCQLIEGGTHLPLDILPLRVLPGHCRIVHGVLLTCVRFTYQEFTW